MKENLTKVSPIPRSQGKTMPVKPDKANAADKETLNEPAPGATQADVIEKGSSRALVNWKDRMIAIKQVAQEAEKPQGGFISFKGGRMSYGDEILPGDKMNVVIIDYRFENDLYKGKYVAGQNRSPDCYAITAPGEVMTPYYILDDQGVPIAPAEDPQSEGCLECKYFQWDSVKELDKTSTSKGKACKTSRRVMCIAADDATTPEKIAKAQVVTFIPPATSVDNFQTMMNQITKVLDTAHFGAVVEVSVKPHDKFLFMVYFKVLQQITNEDLLNALTTKAIKESEREIKYPKNSEREGAAPPPQSTKY